MTRPPYLIVSADLVRTGGMDMANFALAMHLSRAGHEVHLVAHRVADELASQSGVVVHRAARPLRADLLGSPFLARAGRRHAARIAARGGHVVVNGGNCRWGDANWVHYTHAAYVPESRMRGARRAKDRVHRALALVQERQSLSMARVVIANSERTRRDLVERLSLSPERVTTVYYGADPDRFHPPEPARRARMRAALGAGDDVPLVAFVGALGDRRKGFDTLFAAWERLCAAPEWTARLVVVGTGAELARWRERAAGAGMGERIAFLGFRNDVHDVLAACDALVSPTRYEAYGLAVQEALCCGLPSIVTHDAGVAERYPAPLHGLLLRDPDDAGELARVLREWHADAARLAAATLRFSAALRAYTWDDMGRRIAEVVERR